MTMRRLLIRPSGPLTKNDFAWGGIKGQSSFDTNLDPELRGLGDVSLPHRDLVALATAVFLADRTIDRPKAWRRSIELEVPVYDPERWSGVGPELCQTLEILSSDGWELRFASRSATKPAPVAEHPEVDRALLFSGGADSLCGAIRALSDGERLLLVSHWDWSGYAAVQKRLVQQLARRFPNQMRLHQIRLRRPNTQPGGGKFANEPTRRTRSLLFLALGLADASVEPAVPLWMAENGYAALNPPLAPERRGALSTRTTHPLVLHRLEQSTIAVGGRANFTNPFALLTKGQMYLEAAETLGANVAATLLASSHSCSHVRFAIGTGYAPETQCGVCFGCLVRRAAFVAAGLPDASTYLHKAIKPSEQPAHLRSTAAAEIGTVRYAERHGVTASDLLSTGLPENFPLDAALDVTQRGLQELAHVVDSEPDLKLVG